MWLYVVQRRSYDGRLRLWTGRDQRRHRSPWQPRQRPRLLWPTDTKYVTEGAGRSSAWQRRTKTTTTLSTSAVCSTPSPSCHWLKLTKRMNHTCQHNLTIEMDSKLQWISSITSTPRMLSDRSDAFSVRSPAIGFSRCASVERRHCFHRRYGMCTTWLSQVRTAPTTCASRGTAALHVSSDIIIRRWCGRLLKLFSKMKYCR